MGCFQHKRKESFQLISSQGYQIYPTEKIYLIEYVQQFPFRAVISQVYKIYPKYSNQCFKSVQILREILQQQRQFYVN